MQRPERAREPRGWSGAVVLVVMTAAAGGVALLSTGSIGSAVSSAAIVASLMGSAVAFGVFDHRPGRGDGLAPDGRTAALAEHVLSSLDGIEHRRVELGAPWPQLSVGPTGVVVVDVCALEGPVALDARGIRRRDDRRWCCRCDTALGASTAARRALAPTDLDVPVRTIAVVATGTSVTIARDAPEEVSLVTVDRLADELARGPVLPMAVVEASFAVLSRTTMVHGLR
jgi:hypothetical protein